MNNLGDMNVTLSKMALKILVIIAIVVMLLIFPLLLSEYMFRLVHWSLTSALGKSLGMPAWDDGAVHTCGQALGYESHFITTSVLAFITRGA